MPKGEGKGFGWSAKHEETLRFLWKEGHSASQIAKAIGGVTRNGVIGKVHRLGLGARKTPSRPVKKPALARKYPPKPWQREPKRDASPPPPHQPIASLGNAPDDTRNAVLALSSATCKWPHGDPKSPGFRFCMAPKDPEQSFCDAHQRIAYQPRPKARLRDACGG